MSTSMRVCWLYILLAQKQEEMGNTPTRAKVFKVFKSRS